MKPRIRCLWLCGPLPFGAFLLVCLGISIAACERRAPSGATPAPAPPGNKEPLPRGACSYTPYDVLALVYHRVDPPARPMAWVGSGAEAGRLLVSAAGGQDRPAWIFASQGVVAGLAARGEDIRIIGTVYVDNGTLRAVFRHPKPDLRGSRGAFIPRSSVELAFDRLLEREEVPRESVRVPKMERVGFDTLKSLLEKPASDPDALDFAILVDPFLTNLLTEHPDQYEVGGPGLYELQYSIVVAARDLPVRRDDFARLLGEILAAEASLASLPSEEAFYTEAWGRRKDGQPERLPKSIAFRRDALGLRLDVPAVRRLLREEINHLVAKYPAELRMPKDVEAIVDPSILARVAPDRVKQ